MQTKELKVHKYQIPNANFTQTKERATKQSKSCNATRECESPNGKTKQQQAPLTIPNYNP